jgi:cell division protein FtsW (lipid II flippase)
VVVVVMGAILMMTVLSMVAVKVAAMAAVVTMITVVTHLLHVEVIIGKEKTGNPHWICRQ